jgi:small subunit ribosomal protein S6
MRPYEIMVILDSGLDDDATRAIVDRTTKLIAQLGGSVGRVDRWGRRRFAYEVNHKSEGYYFLIEATAEPATMAEVSRTLRLADEVIRHKVVRLPDGVAGRATRPAVSAVSTSAEHSEHGA